MSENEKKEASHADRIIARGALMGHLSADLSDAVDHLAFIISEVENDLPAAAAKLRRVSVFLMERIDVLEFNHDFPDELVALPPADSVPEEEEEGAGHPEPRSQN